MHSHHVMYRRRYIGNWFFVLNNPTALYNVVAWNDSNSSCIFPARRSTEYPCLLTSHNEPISWNRALLEILIAPQLVKRFPTFYGCWVNWIQSCTLTPSSLRIILKLSSYLRRDISISPFPSGFQTEICPVFCIDTTPATHFSHSSSFFGSS